MLVDESGRVPPGWRWGRRRRFVRTQDALTAIVSVRPAELPALTECLKEVEDDIRANPHSHFDGLRMPHFFSWVVLPGPRDEAEREDAPRLVFEANYHGATGDFLDELHREAGKALKEKIYTHCGSFEWTDAYAFKDFFRVHAVKPALLFQSYPGLSTRMIANDDEVHRYLYQSLVQDRALRDALRRRLDGGSEDDRIDSVIRESEQCLQRAIGALGCKDGPPLDFRAERGSRLAQGRFATLIKYLRNLPAAPVLLVALLLLAYEVLRTAMADWKARRKSGGRAPEVPAADGAVAALARSKERLARIRAKEDRQVQNHLALYTELKPGLLRRMTLRVVLFGWKYLAKHYFTEGSLAGIEGIHFARWVIIESGRRWWPAPKNGRPRRLSLSLRRFGLLFLSNYDGSWESYLGNFIDRASSGLTTIWCNTLDFPHTRLRWNTSGQFPYVRIELGAQREEEFKQWVRQHQVPTSFWFSQHPDKSVSNIRRNREIRSRSKPGMRPRARREWLELL